MDKSLSTLSQLIPTTKLIRKKSRNLYVFSAVVKVQHDLSIYPKYYFIFILLVGYTLFLTLSDTIGCARKCDNFFLWMVSLEVNSPIIVKNLPRTYIVSIGYDYKIIKLDKVS